MIIYDFDVLGAGFGPSETHPELAVDPNAILSFPVSFKGFQVISGGNAKVIEPSGNLQLAKLAASHYGKIGKALDAIALCQSLRVGTPEGFDHSRIVTQSVNNIKRSYGGEIFWQKPCESKEIAFCPGLGNNRPQNWELLNIGASASVCSG